MNFVQRPSLAEMLWLRVQVKFSLEEETCGRGAAGAGARGGTGRLGDRIMFPMARSPLGG